MMTSLFSSFDPTSNWNLSLNWMSSLIGLMIIPLWFWFIPSRNQFFFLKITKFLFNEFKMVIGPNHFGIIMTMISLLMIIVMTNVFGLFPYIFTSSSHLVFSLSLALPLWISLMLFGWLNKSIYMFSHLVPQGTPGMLMPFMVCIETISNMIRPGTLAIRLSANMIAGHLLMTLLGNMGNLISFYLISFLMVVQFALLTLEFAVSLIQSYVFSVLMTLYSSEVS
uniref:ATP synthase subunit a n=1 Tax=Chrysolagria sp. CHR01 TaxID=1205615 RepID=A0A0S2MP57_9CUCU|nr:ATP synthase F0 subunit 6 [Chrysolagria sp. CHR01]